MRCAWRTWIPGQAGYDELRAKHEKLSAGYDELKVGYDELRAGHEKLRVEHDKRSAGMTPRFCHPRLDRGSTSFCSSPST